MQISLYIAAALLVGAGCGATVLSAYVFPLRIRVRGQGHGRFAGLTAADADQIGGSRGGIGGRGRGAAAHPVPRPIAA
jgi:hypothetical protein